MTLFRSTLEVFITKTTDIRAHPIPIECFLQPEEDQKGVLLASVTSYKNNCVVALFS